MKTPQVPALPGMTPLGLPDRPGLQTVPFHAIVSLYYNKNPGGHWFSADTMRFFKTVLPELAFTAEGCDYFFYTRETNPSGEKRYSVRCLEIGSGDIETIGTFHSICGPGAAKKATIAALRAQQQHHEQAIKNAGDP